MLKTLLKDHHLILASASPRRQQFLKEMDIPFEVRLHPVEEIYPERLYKFEISDYLAQLKSLPFKEELRDNDILITSDTIVWHQDSALGKPKSREQAIAMLKSLSGNTHEVITSVCFTTTRLQKTTNTITKVHFRELEEEEINFYVDTFKPFDKAGAYGIQEWIGYVGIDRIEGSYFNVVGLPVFEVYKTLKQLVRR